MKWIIPVMMSLFFLGSCSPSTSSAAKSRKPGDFCGISTAGPCEKDSDCKVGGCSRHICLAVSEGDPITSCEYRDCYDAQAFGVQCGCVQGKCQWH